MNINQNIMKRSIYQKLLMSLAIVAFLCTLASAQVLSRDQLDKNKVQAKMLIEKPVQMKRNAPTEKPEVNELRKTAVNPSHQRKELQKEAVLPPNAKLQVPKRKGLSPEVKRMIDEGKAKLVIIGGKPVVKFVTRQDAVAHTLPKPVERKQGTMNVTPNRPTPTPPQVDRQRRQIDPETQIERYKQMLSNEAVVEILGEENRQIIQNAIDTKTPISRDAFKLTDEQIEQIRSIFKTNSRQR